MSIPMREVTASIRADGFKASEVTLTPTDEGRHDQAGQGVTSTRRSRSFGQATGRRAQKFGHHGGTGWERKISPAHGAEHGRQAVSGRVTGAVVSASHAPASRSRCGCAA